MPDQASALSDGDSVEDGTIAGIVVGVVLGLLSALLLVFIVRKQLRSTWRGKVPTAVSIKQEFSNIKGETPEMVAQQSRLPADMEADVAADMQPDTAAGALDDAEERTQNEAAEAAERGAAAEANVADVQVTVDAPTSAASSSVSRPTASPPTVREPNADPQDGARNTAASWLESREEQMWSPPMTPTTALDVPPESPPVRPI